MRRSSDSFPTIPAQRCGVPPHLDERGAVPERRGVEDSGTRPPVAPVDADEELRDLRDLVHDLGNGLATVAVLLEAARDGAVPTFGLLELVEQETTRLLDVVHSGLPRPGTAGHEEPDEIGVREVLAPIARVAGHAGRVGVRLLPGADVGVRVERAALSRVVGNLVDNAVRAAGPGGSVRLAVHAPQADGTVAIDVVDDGPGFPHGPPGSAGHGLELASRLLAAYGGRLELDAVAPRGTRARVVLPAAG